MYPSEKIINIAIKQSGLSKHRFRLGAVVYKRLKVMGFGYNDHIRTHPMSPHPFKTKHAEFSALLNAVGRYGANCTSNSSVYVYRMRADGSSGLAEPCKFCYKMLKLAGINEIFWSKNGAI